MKKTANYSSCAIYARYSNIQQHDESLDDQINQCKRKAVELGIVVNDNNFYVDPAISGSTIERPGLIAMQESIRNGTINTILIDDLSRLSRSVIQTLTIVYRLMNLGVRLIAIADNIDTERQDCKLQLQVKAILNENYLDDLRLKTKRGQLGLVEKNLVFWRRYGYEIIDSSTHIRKDGTPFRDSIINPKQAKIVKKIYKQYAEGFSLNQIACNLNKTKTKTSKNFKAGWNVSTIYRILTNPGYTGRNRWNKSKTIRDPLTGKKTTVERERKDWHEYLREDLRIITDELYEIVQDRLGKQETNYNKGYVEMPRKSFFKKNPSYLLTGLLKCSKCDYSIGLVSGKGNGYYGCLNRSKGTCDNMVIVPRKKLENKFIESLMREIIKKDILMEKLQKTEIELKRKQKNIPVMYRKKRIEKRKIEEKIEKLTNFIEDFSIGDNKLESVAARLLELEYKIKEANLEIQKYKNSNFIQFKVPNKRQLNDRINNLEQKLNKRNEESIEIIRTLTDKIMMTPIFSKKQKPHYVADCDISIVGFMSEDFKSAKSLLWWRRRESNPSVTYKFVIISIDKF